MQLLISVHWDKIRNSIKIENRKVKKQRGFYSFFSREKKKFVATLHTRYIT